MCSSTTVGTPMYMSRLSSCFKNSKHSLLKVCGGLPLDKIHLLSSFRDVAELTERRLTFGRFLKVLV
jgi:hypothetical protein